MSSRDAVLVLNCGSSSVKSALFAMDRPGSRLLSAAIERVATPQAQLRVEGDGGEHDERVDAPDHDAAIEQLLRRIEVHAPRMRVRAAGHRVVHGGPDCDCPVRITAALEARLRELIPLAPLHLPHNLAGIAAIGTRRPDLLQVACFDTAFHAGLPRVARLTGLPRELEGEGIRRYGFHGLSCEYVLEELRTREGSAAARGRIVIAHLGNGASMTAVRDGRGVETSMGFSTLAGLLMGTRCGDLDPGIVLYLLQARGMSGETLEDLLYRRSGLLGVSGMSRNMEDLLQRQELAEVREAIELFCYRARSHLGALVTVLGGLDRLVFTGGIGAQAPEIRERIAAELEFLGVAIDGERNRAQQRTISPPGAAVTVQAFPTDEETIIASHTQRLTGSEEESHHA
ncbi:MAG: acetate/propionate family kinase [Gammaproteobacteria bacterium]|nr:acetate/propionate family kinase [Gammaproteobacteria bacterium]NIR84359.1 acetate/propionate family kinase [Gammaproteobacteria bacterium]NIR89875.1 acetate/propionate family kinase [Gammaproteobacteria bacterium]NIU05742.1 acetate/propionate family kinase [Gammaproteobacteria bacterium]NIV52502.1 acetate/propionate family kinase [Gammaproteobacteria bacterium]